MFYNRHRLFLVLAGILAWQVLLNIFVMLNADDGYTVRQLEWVIYCLG